MRVLIARDGVTFTDGENYGKKVYLGSHDSPENWREIPDEDVPVPDPTDPTEAEYVQAAKIMLGEVD